VLDPAELSAAPAAPRPRPTFRLEQLATGHADDGPLALDDATVKAMCDDLAKKMGEGEFGADRMLDLTLKTAAELEDELAAMAGLPKDRAAWGDKADAIAKAAETLRQVMQQKNPNRRTDGKIVLNGKTVIVKQVKFRDMKEQFVGEARAHWQLSGGGSGEGDPHVVKMDGAAVDDRGNLSIVMEEAKGRDLDVFANALNECCRMGIIPPAARNALTQDIARQAAEGLKAVHQQNDLHLDLKAKNFFVDENGKVVIGDFGGAEAMGEDGTVSGNIATTPRRALRPLLDRCRLAFRATHLALPPQHRRS
jgi:serine/threonine protein kinase